MPRLRVEAVYALPTTADLVRLELPEGSTAAAAAAASGLAGRHGIAADQLRLGIGGRVVDPGTLLHDGDRVELLRPLALDPMAARRERARRRRKR